MIASLTGIVRGRDTRSVTLDVHGVGFRVFTLVRTIDQCQLNSTVSFMTMLHVREDALELYGFLEAGELRLFERLLTVSGVGPKVALGVLSAAPVADLEKAIEQGQATVLTNVSGVGKKTAERIIVDLRGKLNIDDSGDTSLSTVIEALVQLGYQPREAREAAVTTSSELTIEKRIAAALKHIGAGHA